MSGFWNPGYEYMLNAMWVSAMVGGLRVSLLLPDAERLVADWRCARTPSYRAWRSLYARAAVALGAFLSGGLAAGSMLFLNQRSRLKEDAIIGLIFSSFFGIGLFMVSLNPTSVNIQTIVLGNILAIAPKISSSWRLSAWCRCLFCCSNGKI
jgi:manganese/iron transport system permease protein